MVLNALQINSYVLAKKCQLSDWHLQIANSGSIIPLAIHSGDVWVRACNFWLPRCPSYSINAVVHGKQRLSKPRDCHPILTSSRTKRRPAALPCKKCEWWERHEQAPVKRIIHWRRDMWGPIPNRTRRTVARPGSVHYCRPTSLQWRTRRTAFFLPQIPMVSAAAYNSTSPARCRTWLEHTTCIRARPSCCGFWNLVNAHAWKFPQAYGAFLAKAILQCLCKSLMWKLIPQLIENSVRKVLFFFERKTTLLLSFQLGAENDESFNLWSGSIFKAHLLWHWQGQAMSDTITNLTMPANVRTEQTCTTSTYRTVELIRRLLCSFKKIVSLLIDCFCCSLRTIMFRGPVQLITETISHQCM